MSICDDRSSAAAPVAGGPSMERRERRFSRRTWAIVTAVIVVLCALRLVHLTADTPAWVSPGSAGEYVDEGYKTLSPRNLVLFGRTHWHPADDYEGWMTTSPVTNWSYYVAFRLGGANLATARVTTLVFFAAFLFATAWTLSRRMPATLALGGVILLGLESTLFFFSRIALFEIPIAVFLYAWLYVLARVGRKRVWAPLVATLAIAPLLAFGLKLSAVAYLAPVLGALLVRAVVLRGVPRSPAILLALGVGAIGLVVTLISTHWLWGERLALHPVRFVMNLFSSPLPVVAPFLFLAGWLAGLHLLLTRPREILESPYRCGVVALVLLGPVVFGFFPYDPPRYYVPLLPAFVLIGCEWFAINGRRVPAPVPGWISGAVAITGITIWLVAVLRAVNRWIIAPFAIGAGVEPGIGKRGLVIIGLPVALAVAGAAWARRGRWLGGAWVQTAIVAAFLLVGAQGVARIGAFFAQPRYDGNDTRQAIASAILPQSSIIGDWAPFFTLGTDLRPLYMNRAFNVAGRIEELRPDYILYSDTEDSQRSFATLEQNPRIQIGAPVITDTYNNREVRLHRLEYASPSPARDEAAQHQAAP